VRLDLGGIGDSEGDAHSLAEIAEFYDPRFTAEVSAALDELERRGLGERFAVVGLCSGSTWAFQAALADERIVGAFMINPRILFWDPAIDAARELRRTRLLVNPITWRRILRGEVSSARFAKFLRWIFREPLRRLHIVRGSALETSSMVDRVAQAFDELRLRGTDLRFFFCDGEPLHDELIRDGLLSQRDRWPNVTTKSIPGRDHTLRPLWMHEHVDAALDAALEQSLTASAPEERALRSA
jgi:hypothetical protein